MNPISRVIFAAFFAAFGLALGGFTLNRVDIAVAGLLLMAAAFVAEWAYERFVLYARPGR